MEPNCFNKDHNLKEDIKSFDNFHEKNN